MPHPPAELGSPPLSRSLSFPDVDGRLDPDPGRPERHAERAPSGPPGGYTTIRAAVRPGLLLRVWLNPYDAPALLSLGYGLCRAITWTAEAKWRTGPVAGLPELWCGDFGGAGPAEGPDRGPDPGARPGGPTGGPWQEGGDRGPCCGPPVRPDGGRAGPAGHGWVRVPHRAPALPHHVGPSIGLRAPGFAALAVPGVSASGGWAPSG